MCEMKSISRSVNQSVSQWAIVVVESESFQVQVRRQVVTSEVGIVSHSWEPTNERTNRAVIIRACAHVKDAAVDGDINRKVRRRAIVARQLLRRKELFLPLRGCSVVSRSVIGKSVGKSVSE